MRHLARDLGLAVGTVNRAYRELETAGLISTSRGGGTRVTARPAPSTAERAKRLADLAQSYAVGAAALGVTSTEAHEALANAWP